MINTPLIVDHLTIDYRHGSEYLSAVKDVSIKLHRGETLGLVGESGSGKSTLALALMNLLPSGESRISGGRIILNDRDVTRLPNTFWREIRGKKIAMVFQDPFSSLNPVLTIGYQLREALARVRLQVKPSDELDLLAEVQLSDGERILASYPHQLSGGQRQRVMVALALAQNPEILIADEPTTALDVTVQSEIVKMLKRIQGRHKLSMIFITHNLGLVRMVADRVGVLKEGLLVELGSTAQILKDPQQLYTKTLISSVPRLPVGHWQDLA